MLVLTRKFEEKVVITFTDEEGEELERMVITVLGAEQGSARLGFTAGKKVKIQREEIQVRIDKGEGRPSPKENTDLPKEEVDGYGRKILKLTAKRSSNRR